MTRTHNVVVEDQFGPRANAYVSSAVHAAGADLDALEDIVRRCAPTHALDLGTGGGHVAYRMAPYAAQVTASDLSADMLSAVAATAVARGLTNITTRTAPAEALPFADASFDFLACRFSAHHWQDLDAGLRQARRVLRSGATAVFIDAISPGNPAYDTHLQAIELLRDPSHVRDYSAPQWLDALTRAGFVTRAVTTRQLPIDYASWIERMQTPAEHCAAIRALQRLASAETRAHFAIAEDGSFLLDTIQIEVQAL